jgi:signal peptidase I
MFKKKKTQPTEIEEGSFMDELCEWAAAFAEFFLPAIAVFMLFSSVFLVAIVPSGSMEGTLLVGDTVFGTRYNGEEIERYDVMVFVPPDDEDSLYVKRVIGLPGDTVDIVSGIVYVNGEETRTDFLLEEQKIEADMHFEVPENCYFMMGDNRNYSYDSRYWPTPYVPVENMVGHPFFIIYPFDRLGDFDGILTTEDYVKGGVIFVATMAGTVFACIVSKLIAEKIQRCAPSRK